jgi:hypothetical protein
MRAISSGLCTPPPQTSTRVVEACGLQCVGDRDGGELEQRGLHVLDAFMAVQMRIHPVEMELFAAGALWGGRRTMGRPASARTGPHPPARGGEAAIGIERRADMALAPGIHQRIGRAGIETAHVASARQVRLAMPPVEHGAVLVRARSSAAWKAAPAVRPDRQRPRRGGGSRRRW